jgi:acetyl-CoA C-acetyltransferase
VAAIDPEYMGVGPIPAIHALLKQVGMTMDDIDVVEINEAFAVVPILSARRLGLDPELVNVNGGALALGHPIGVSGARITLHLALELARRGGGIGAAALCGGGGQGEAVVLRVPTR